jgi:hypothetical protein
MAREPAVAVVVASGPVAAVEAAVVLEPVVAAHLQWVARLPDSGKPRRWDSAALPAPGDPPL